MFKKISKLDIDWKTINTIEEILEDKADAFNDALEEDLKACAENIKDGKRTEVDDCINKIFTNKKVNNEIRELLNNLLFGYNSLECVREMEHQDCNLVKVLINDIFEMTILRKDISFIQKYKNYGLKNKDELKNIVITFWGLVRYYIMNRFSQESIVYHFNKETRLENDSVKTFADCVDKNYHQLQMVVLLDEMNRMNQYK